jgi:hypothetical protein
VWVWTLCVAQLLPSSSVGRPNSRVRRGGGKAVWLIRAGADAGWCVAGLASLFA